MKQKSCLLLAVWSLVLILALPTLGETKTDMYTIGPFTYSVPSDWITVKGDYGTFYHYTREEGDCDSGIALVFRHEVAGAPPETEEGARFFLNHYVNTMLDPVNGESELLNRFDIEIHGRYATIVRLQTKVDTEVFQTNNLVVINGKDILELTYLDKVNTVDEQLKIFSEIVNSVEIEE